uniref:Putative membrane protein n=1 Tax=Corethrella appendiculata TaxID=1370023 RepID=U5ELW0_9DIPT
MNQLATMAISLILVFAVLFSNSEAKRGCAAFGHSCYGGHGKRSDNSIDTDSSSIPIGKFLQNYNKIYPFNINSVRGFDPTIPQSAPQFDERQQAIENTNKNYKYALYNLLKQWMDEIKQQQQQQPILQEQQQQLTNAQDTGTFANENV